MTNSNWYVLRVLTGKERDAADKIQSLPEAQALVPMRLMLEQRHGQWIEKTRSMYPGYVFLHLPHLDADLYYRLMAIDGIIRLLGSSAVLPSPVPPEEMTAVLALGGEGKPVGVSQAIRLPSGRIKVLDGPLRSIPGRIIKVDARRRRATVALSLMGTQMPVQLALRVNNQSPTPGGRFAAPMLQG